MKRPKLRQPTMNIPLHSRAVLPLNALTALNGALVIIGLLLQPETIQQPFGLLFVARNKNVRAKNLSPLRERTLFIDARKLGSLIGRTHKDFSDEEINKVAATYPAWRGEEDTGEYQDVSGFCKSATTGESREHGYVSTPGRYVGAVEIEDDGVPFEEKMAELASTLYEQFAEADRLETIIKRNLEILG